MSLSQLFNYSVTRGPGAAAPPGTGQETQPSSVSAFLTPQSLVSFPIASTIVNLLWRGVQRFAGAPGTKQRVALLLSAMVGLFVYLASSSESELFNIGSAAIDAGQFPPEAVWPRATLGEAWAPLWLQAQLCS